MNENLGKRNRVTFWLLLREIDLHGQTAMGWRSFDWRFGGTMFIRPALENRKSIRAQSYVNLTSEAGRKVLAMIISIFLSDEPS